MRLPPGVSESDYSAAIEQWRQIVGDAFVFTDDAELDLYRDAYSIFWEEDEERIASGAVAPSSLEEVQAVVRVANEHRIPIYPVSTGRNLGYGGSAPAYSGSVVLDLKRMNRIVELNKDLHYVVVEPGVSFFDLFAALRESGVRLLSSQPAPGWGSPVGNALDGGIGNPAGDHFRNACGIEAVLPSGEVMRTGLGALPAGKKLWPLHHNGVGPSLEGLFHQSNFGVVTKMGFNLFHWPETTRSLYVGTRDEGDLDQMMQICNDLYATRVVPSSPSVGSPLWQGARALGQIDPELRELDRRGGGTASDWNSLARERDVDVFRATLSFDGADRVTQAQLDTAMERFASAMPQLTLRPSEITHSPSDEQVEEGAPVPGQPGLQAFWRDTAQHDWDGHMWFSPLLPAQAQALRRSQQLFRSIANDYDFFWGWQPALSAFSNVLFLIVNFNVSKTDREHNRRTREMYLRMLRAGAEEGFIEYRAAPAFYDAIMDQMSFSDHAFRRVNEAIKDAIDPNGIISAGRYGIWPKHLRRA